MPGTRDKDDSVSWLKGVLLGVNTPENLYEMGLASKGVVDIGDDMFDIYGLIPDLKPLVATDVFNLYAALHMSGQLGLFKIAATPEMNGFVEEEIAVLQAMTAGSDAIDAESVKPFRFKAQFPQVTAVINAGERRAFFIGFDQSIATYKQFAPLPKLLDGQRVDLQTTVWILGKLLRLLAFAHRDANYSCGSVRWSNILLEPDLHGVFVFDWSYANKNPSLETRLEEVKQAGRIAWAAAGGDVDKDPPHDPDIMTIENYRRYLAFLQAVMTGTWDAITAHGLLYDLANSIWPKEQKTDEGGSVTKRPFHSWVTYDLK